MQSSPDYNYSANIPVVVSTALQNVLLDAFLFTHTAQPKVWLFVTELIVPPTTLKYLHEATEMHDKLFLQDRQDVKLKIENNSLFLHRVGG